MSRCRCDYCFGSQNRRQEIKHGGLSGEEELPTRGPRKKTRKWCKGKVGVSHIWVRTKPWSWSPNTIVEVCSSCGKHGRYIW